MNLDDIAYQYVMRIGEEGYFATPVARLLIDKAKAKKWLSKDMFAQYFNEQILLN